MQMNVIQQVAQKIARRKQEAKRFWIGSSPASHIPLENCPDFGDNVRVGCHSFLELFENIGCSHIPLARG